MEKKNHLELLQQELEKWRKNKRGQKQIPDEIWKRVQELPAEYSLHEITRKLKLEWQKVKKLRRVVGEEAEKESKDFFVEVNAGIVRSGVEIDFEKADGQRLKIRGVHDSALLNLVRVFLGQEG